MSIFCASPNNNKALWAEIRHGPICASLKLCGLKFSSAHFIQMKSLDARKPLYANKTQSLYTNINSPISFSSVGGKELWGPPVTLCSADFMTVVAPLKQGKFAPVSTPGHIRLPHKEVMQACYRAVKQTEVRGPSLRVCGFRWTWTIRFQTHLKTNLNGPVRTDQWFVRTQSADHGPIRGPTQFFFFYF